MNKTDTSTLTITEDDMSNLIMFFRIPTRLYEQISEYARSRNIQIKIAMAELLSNTNKKLNSPSSAVYSYYLDNYKKNYIDITEQWWLKKPKIVKSGLVKQFPLKFPPELKTEIFKIFVQTHYKTGTPEMNVEICARLVLALTDY